MLLLLMIENLEKLVLIHYLPQWSSVFLMVYTHVILIIQHLHKL